VDTEDIKAIRFVTRRAPMSRRSPTPTPSEAAIDLSNKILGIATIKGSWNAAVEYLSETGNFSGGGAYIVVRRVEKENPEIKLPWGKTI
jgi:hypothetical protein